jgi:predicted Zn-dependent peptidase
MYAWHALVISAALTAAPAEKPWELPIAVKTLGNGLTVVVSEDHRSPVVGVSVVYKVGMRLEPRNRTGFAHLFEHLMFEGTPVAPKGVLDRVIEGGGGNNNGSTRPDYTNYVETVPVSALEPILWLEADRMKTLDFSEKNLRNQQEVVKEEIRVNVKNQPYSLFFWLDMTALAFDKWENAHDGYGSFKDLDTADIRDVAAFHQQFYGPNNAVLSIAGDLTPTEGFALAEKYFAGLPSRPVPPPSDFTEGLATKERRADQTDALAKIPGLALGWRMPACGTPDHVPAVLLTELLQGGDASRLYQALVKGKGLMVDLTGGINWPLSTPWSYRGPVLLTLFGTYKPGTRAEQILEVVDAEVARIAKEGVTAKELGRIKAHLTSQFFAGLEGPLDRADALGIAQALNGQAAFLNTIPARIQAVTSADLQRVAAQYLARTNRTVIDRQPK